jgi:hypothetical protein
MRKTALFFTLLGVVAPVFPAVAGGTVTRVAPKVQLQVKNNLPQNVCYLYISAVTDTNWGNDVLGERTLISGEVDTYEMDAGSWDIKAEDCSHTELYSVRGFAISSNTTLNIGTANASMRTVNLQVVNGSASTVCYLYISAADQQSWGADVLEERVLTAGETDMYEISVGTWDFKAEDCDHKELMTLMQIPISDASTLTLTN